MLSHWLLIAIALITLNIHLIIQMLHSLPPSPWDLLTFQKSIQALGKVGESMLQDLDDWMVLMS